MNFDSFISIAWLVLVLLVSFFYLFIKTYKGEVKGDENQCIMKHQTGLQIFISVPSLIFFILIAVFLVISPPKLTGNDLIFENVFIFVVFLLILLFIAALNLHLFLFAIVINDRGIEKHSFWGKVTTIHWDDLKDIVYSKTWTCYVLTSFSGKSIKISGDLKGMKNFYVMVKKFGNTHNPNISTFTKDILD